MKQLPPLSEALGLLNLSTQDLDKIARQNVPDFEAGNAELLAQPAVFTSDD